jgi:hypothetical protein
MSDETCEIVNSMKITLTTGKNWGSSSDDPVKLYIGEHFWVLDHPFCNDFEKGKTDIFDLEIPEGLTSDWFQYFCLRKDNPVTGSKWLLNGIKVEINERVIYENNDIEIWFSGNKTSWCVPDFYYGKCRGNISPDFDVRQ